MGETVGTTCRLDPLDRIRELSDVSVPFNFDVHALFFSKDAVGIETAMHERLAAVRVNIVNRRREFFRATPLNVKAHLAELAGELLQFHFLSQRATDDGGASHHKRRLLARNSRSAIRGRLRGKRLSLDWRRLRRDERPPAFSDGQARRGSRVNTPQINVVLNWFEELKRLVPTN
jgi:hypothetical protein